MPLKSEWILCPHCSARLQKSEQDKLLSQVKEFMAFGPDTVRCGACNGTIDRKKIIDGDYDEKPKSVYIEIAILGALSLAIWTFCC